MSRYKKQMALWKLKLTLNKQWENMGKMIKIWTIYNFENYLFNATIVRNFRNEKEVVRNMSKNAKNPIFSSFGVICSYITYIHLRHFVLGTHSVWIYQRLCDTKVFEKIWIFLYQNHLHFLIFALKDGVIRNKKPY